MMKFASVVVAGSALIGCQLWTLDVSGLAGAGDECDPTQVACGEGLVCAVNVCALPLEVHGRVIDASTDEPIAGARVHGQNVAGAAVGASAVTDADGRYVLPVAAAREADGSPVDGDLTLLAFAAGYQPFPAGLRVALPIAVDAADLGDERMAWVVELPTTTIALFPLPAELRGGLTVSGRVGGDAPGGALVVAEGPTPAAYGIADPDGAYALFNVRDGEVTVRAYRQGLAALPARVAVAGEDRDGVDLAAADVEDLARVSGSVSLVDPGDGEATSVVLVPDSVFDEALARGPMPFGLRAPGPGRAPDVAGPFAIAGVPAGKYRVLAGFENDFLVRDPDLAIGGTGVRTIDVQAGADAEVGSFKMTGALAVVGPGAEEPEVVVGEPTFVFARDPGADHYLLRVFDGFGLVVWEVAVPRGEGSEPVEVPYAGPALTSGSYYQFRAVSLKDEEGTTAISATEDLRGVFIAG